MDFSAAQGDAHAWEPNLGEAAVVRADVGYRERQCERGARAIEGIQDCLGLRPRLDRDRLVDAGCHVEVEDHGLQALSSQRFRVRFRAAGVELLTIQGHKQDRSRRS